MSVKAETVMQVEELLNELVERVAGEVGLILFPWALRVSLPMISSP